MSDKPNKEGAPFGNRNRARDAENLKSVTIRLLPVQIAKLKQVAKSQNVPYNELIRNWIDSLKAP